MKPARKSKPVRAIQRHRKLRRLGAGPETQAIVLASQTPPPVQIVSAVPSVLATVKSLEQVRRFVTRCMNVDLQRALAKLPPGGKLDPDVQKRLEVDWGTIPGVDKPFLLQPGAEKFCFWLNLRPKFRTVIRELGDGHMETSCSVTVYTKKTNEEVFEGPECSCSTMESNYRFRFQERIDNDGNNVKPPQAETDRLKKLQLGKFKKKAIWARGKKTGEEWVWLDRVENPNIHDERNKVRQIGQKRALVKCCRNMGALSELFVSDPSEWDIPDEEYNAGPTEDSHYTPGGRKITIIEPEKPQQARVDDFNERMTRELLTMPEDEREGFITSQPKAEQEAIRRRMAEVQNIAAKRQESKRSEAPKSAPKTDVYPGFEYILHPENGSYEVTGPEALKKEHRDLLAPHYSRVANAIMCTAEQMGKLLSQLESRKVKIRGRVTQWQACSTSSTP